MTVIVAVGKGESPESALSELERELEKELEHHGKRVVSVDRAVYELRPEKTSEIRNRFYSESSFEDAQRKATEEDSSFTPKFYSVGMNFTIE